MMRLVEKEGGRGEECVVGQLPHCRADRVLACICMIIEEADAVVRPLRGEPTEYSNTENKEDGETEKRGSKRRGYS